MIRHLARLIWNRKRQNFLLTIEIFFSFLVLFGVVLLTLLFAYNARLPLGYDIDRVWTIEVDRKEPDSDPEVKARHRETFRQLVVALREQPETEMVAAAFTSPYGGSTHGSQLRSGGRDVPFYLNNVTDDFRELLRMPLVAGRWFSREDDAATWTPVVINERMAREIFAEGNAVGQLIRDERPLDRRRDPAEKRETKRVVGVVQEFRQHGELSPPGNYLFYRQRFDDPDPNAGLPNLLLIRIKAGTPASFEETLVKRAMAVARSWSFEVQPIEAQRTTSLQLVMAPVIAVGVVAAFLLLMVALGLTGVVWQSVTQRIREFGLRRAKGATILNVRHQVLVETVIMTSLALVVGVLLVSQLALLPLPSELDVVPTHVFVASVAISMAAIYLLTLACGWYPSRLATKVQPAEALHYE